MLVYLTSYTDKMTNSGSENCNLRTNFPSFNCKTFSWYRDSQTLWGLIVHFKNTGILVQAGFWHLKSLNFTRKILPKNKILKG
jgi:hypothetical protein